MLAFLYTILNIIHLVLSDYIFKSFTYKYIEYFIVSFGFLVIFYEGKLLKKILVYCELNAIILFTELISCQIVFGALGLSENDMREMSVIRILVMVSCNIGCGLLAILILHLQKKVKFSLSFQKLKYILLGFGLQIVGCSFYNILMINEHISINAYFIIYIAISMFLDLYLLNVMAKVEIKEETEQKIIYFQKQEQTNTMYYAQVANNINHLVELRTEYETELQKVYRTIGKEYSTNRVIGETNVRNEEKHILVDNILAGLKQRLEYQGISYKLDFNIPKDIAVEALDLSSILTNLFDNAIEAIEKCDKVNTQGEEYDLNAKAEVCDGKLQIRVKNRKNPNEKIKKRGSYYVTSKKDQQAHGYGMKIIERIVGKYHGTMEVDYTDVWFENQITIPNS